MARNVIGERVLGFPREYAADRGVPFNQVRHGQAADCTGLSYSSTKTFSVVATDDRYLDQRQDVVRGAAGRGNQHTVAALPARPVAGGGQRADARRSEVGDPAQIDRQRCYAGTAFDRDLAVQGGCGVGVDVAADDDAAGVRRADRRRIRSRLPADRLPG